MYKKVLAILLLSVVLVFFGCSGQDEKDYSIDVPTEEISAYVGDYISPFYNVVNGKKEIMNKYEVILKSVKDANGNEVAVKDDGRTVSVNNAGVFKFIYGVSGKSNIKDAEVSIVFSFIPPEITVNELDIPFTYHKGLTYEIPEYSFGADADLEKSYFKIYHEDASGNKTEIAYENGTFVPTSEEGKYLLTYYAEGNLDNSQEKVFEVDAGIGPEEIIDGRIGYCDEEFGQYQFTSVNAKISYSNEVHFEGENGSTRFELTYADSRYATMDLCVQKDVSDYDYIEFFVYNANDYDLHFVMDVWYAWKELPKKEWTKVVIPVESIIDTYGSQYITSLEDITGLLFKIGLASNPSETPVGTVLYFSSMNAYKNPEPEEVVEGKIGYFDEGYGAFQVDPVCSEISYSTDRKYGEEKGSTKVVLTAGNQLIYGRLLNLVENDISGYDYLIYRVYNDNDYSIQVWFDWQPRTNCAPKQWTEVKVLVSGFPNDTNNQVMATDIKNMALKVAKSDDGVSVPEGMTFYLSAMTAKVNPEPKQVVQGRIGYFDEEYGAFQVAPVDSKISYSTDCKYGEEDGSTKVVLTAGNQLIYGRLSILKESDISGYDYLIYRVYNDNDYGIQVWFDWQPRTNCAPKQWTEVKVPVSGFPGNANNQVMATDIKNMALKVAKSDDGVSVPEGMTFYLSAMTAKVNPEPKQVVQGRIGYFDEEYGAFQVAPVDSKISYSTDCKYGEETGSTKVVLTAGNQLIYGRLSILKESDISGYDYLIYRVYNDNDYGIQVWFDWQPRTNCAPKQWTEVKVPVSGFPGNANNQVMATDIKNMALKVAKSDDGVSVPEGMTFYLSAMTAFND